MHHGVHAGERVPGHGRVAQVDLPDLLRLLIKEYARQCGHADLLRERLDGATGE